MTMEEWIHKYIPYRKKRYISRKSGLDKNSIKRWAENRSQPSTLSIIYTSLAISKEFKVDYRTVVLEGIRAAAKVRRSE